MPAMTREELRERASAVYGPHWQTPLANERGVTDRTVRRWVADEIDDPVLATALRSFLVSRRVIHVPAASAAPPGVDRGEAAIRLSDAIVDIVLDGAGATGWSEREMTVALYSVMVDRLTQKLSREHVRELLLETLDQVGS